MKHSEVFNRLAAVLKDVRAENEDADVFVATLQPDDAAIVADEFRLRDVRKAIKAAGKDGQGITVEVVSTCGSPRDQHRVRNWVFDPLWLARGYDSVLSSREGKLLSEIAEMSNRVRTEQNHRGARKSRVEALELAAKMLRYAGDIAKSDEVKTELRDKLARAIRDAGLSSTNAPSGADLLPRDQWRAEMLDEDNIALGIYEFPQGYCWWVRLPVEDLHDRHHSLAVKDLEQLGLDVPSLLLRYATIHKA